MVQLDRTLTSQTYRRLIGEVGARAVGGKGVERQEEWRLRSQEGVLGEGPLQADSPELSMLAGGHECPSVQMGWMTLAVLLIHLLRQRGNASGK